MSFRILKAFFHRNENNMKYQSPFTFYFLHLTVLFSSFALVSSFGLSKILHAELLTIDKRGGLAGVYFFPDRSPDLIETFLFIKSGAFYDEGREGLAHYLEHLVWLNAVNPDGRATTARHDGASLDGLTTTYSLKGKPEELDAYLETLTKVFEPPSLDEAFMREEVDIIKREYDYRVLERPLYPVYRDIQTHLFGKMGRGRAALGTPETISKFTPEAAVALHARTHVPANAVLFIMGNADLETVEPLVEKHFGGMAAGSPPPRYERSAFQERREILETSVEGLTSPRLIYAKRIMLETPLAKDRLQLRLSLLHSIWDSTLEGSLAKPLRFDDFITNNFSLSLSSIEPGEVLMTFNAVPDEGVELSSLLKAFEETLKVLADDGIPGATFERIRDKRLAALDDAVGRRWLALDLVADQIANEAEPISAETYIERFGGTTLDELNVLVHALSGPGDVVAVSVSPK